MASILAQVGVDVSVRIRDDGSTDGTQDVLSGLASKWPGRVTVVEDSLGSSGSASANFFRLINGFQVEPGSYVALSDQDDIWFPDKLAHAVASMKATGSGGYSSNLVAYSETTGVCWLVDKAAPERPYDYLFQGASAGCTYVLDSSAFQRVQLALQQAVEVISPSASHDWLIYAICRSAGISWAHDTEARILYRQHESNVYGAMPGFRGVSERIRMVRSKWYQQSVVWLANIAAGDEFETEVLDRVRRLSLFDRLWLAHHASLFRRRAKERYFLIAMFLSGIF